MSADLFSFDAARAERERRVALAPGRAAGLPVLAMTALVGASLAMVACGLVAAVLWFVWGLAGILP